MQVFELVQKLLNVQARDPLMGKNNYPWRCLVNLDTFIITVFCQVDDIMKELLQGRRLRERGPMPSLADSEVVTMEVVGEYLGLGQDQAIYRYFRRHYHHFFPALRKVHRTTFVRQAANLCYLKEQMWQRLVSLISYDPNLALVDSFPIPVCQFARAYRCKRFKGEVAFGKDSLSRQTFYGFRMHVRLGWPGVITRFALAAGNVHETHLVSGLTYGTKGLLVGDRNYWSPSLKKELQSHDLKLEAPFRSATRDPWPSRSALLSRIRYRIDTVFGQLVDRYQAKRVWARDIWHLSNRLLRKTLSHTLAFFLNQDRGHPPLQIAKLVS